MTGNGRTHNRMTAVPPRIVEPDDSSASRSTIPSTAQEQEGTSASLLAPTGDVSQGSRSTRYTRKHVAMAQRARQILTQLSIARPRSHSRSPSHSGAAAGSRRQSSQNLTDVGVFLNPSISDELVVLGIPQSEHETMMKGIEGLLDQTVYERDEVRNRETFLDSLNLSEVQLGEVLSKALVHKLGAVSQAPILKRDRYGYQSRRGSQRGIDPSSPRNDQEVTAIDYEIVSAIMNEVRDIHEAGPQYIWRDDDDPEFRNMVMEIISAWNDGRHHELRDPNKYWKLTTRSESQSRGRQP